MLARWKVMLTRLSEFAFNLAAVHARHPLERWLSMVEEDRKAHGLGGRSAAGSAKNRRL
jgi:hypothetical protein